MQSITTQNILPDATRTRNIGSPSLLYSTIYAENANIPYLTAINTITRTVFPGLDNLYDLGRVTQRYKEAFVNQVNTKEIVCTTQVDLSLRAPTINTFGDLKTMKVLPTTVGYDIGEAAIPYRNIYADGTISCNLLDATKIRKTWASAWANNNGRYTRPGALGNWACIAMDPLTVQGKSSDNDFSITGDITNADGSEGVTPRFYHIQQSIPQMDYAVNASIVFKSSLSTAAETVIAFFKNGTILNTTNASGISNPR